jgi:hypothetical protein
MKRPDLRLTASSSREGPDCNKKSSFDPRVREFYVCQFRVVGRESYIRGKASFARTSISYDLI